MGYGDESVVVYFGKLVDNIRINVVKERMMNKKELKRRGKGLLALMLAFMMMFGSSMTVFAGNTYRLDIPLGGGYGGYTVSGAPTGLRQGRSWKVVILSKLSVEV